MKNLSFKRLSQAVEEISSELNKLKELSLTISKGSVHHQEQEKFLTIHEASDLLNNTVRAIYL